MVAPDGLESKATENHRKPVPRCAKNHVPHVQGDGTGGPQRNDFYSSTMAQNGTKIQLIPTASSINTLHRGWTSYGRLDVCQTGRNHIELSEHPAFIRPAVQRPGPRRQHLQRWRIQAAAVRPSHGFEQLDDVGVPFLSRQVQRSLSSQR